MDPLAVDFNHCQLSRINILLTHHQRPMGLQHSVMRLMIGTHVWWLLVEIFTIRRY